MHNLKGTGHRKDTPARNANPDGRAEDLPSAAAGANLRQKQQRLADRQVEGVPWTGDPSTRTYERGDPGSGDFRSTLNGLEPDTEANAAIQLRG